MYRNAFYNFTQKTNTLNQLKKNHLQYQGYLTTDNIFNRENNPFSQNLFEKIECTSPVEINVPTHLMLGKRVEVFFKKQVTEANKYEILYENTQIQSAKRTIGELDFILRDKQTLECKHIEVSYKFYLFDPLTKGKEIDKWIGPNRRDTLAKKVSKLSTHQFPMLYKSETKEKINIDFSHTSQEVFFKAQLFIPHSSADQIFKSINPDAICGTYVTFEEFKTSKFKDFEFFIPEKQDWLISPIENTTWHFYMHIIKTLKESIQNEKSLLLWCRDINARKSKFFVTWW